MTKRSVTFRKIDVTRAIEAVKAGGVTIGRVVFEKEKFVIETATAPADASGPLDEWLKTNAR